MIKSKNTLIVLSYIEMKISKLSDFFAKNQRLLLFSIFTLTFISRLPGIFILEKEIEPGIDGAYYHNVASNILAGNGEVSSIKDRWFVDWESNYGNVETPYSFGPLYVYLLSFLFRIDDSLISIRILNSILSSLSMVIYFLFVKRLFTQKTAFVSTLILIFVPLNYLYSVSLLTESLYTLLLFLTFYTLTLDRFRFKYFLLGVLSGLCFLCRIPGLFVILSILTFLIFNKGYKKTTTYGISLIFTVSPWLILNYVNTGFLFPYLSVYSEVYPILWEGQHHLRTLTFISIYYRIFYFLTHLSSLNLLSFLIIFIILGVYQSSQKKKFWPIFGMLFISIFYHVGHHYTIRYMLPIICFLIPFGINQIINLSKLKIIKENVTSSNVFLLIIVALYILPAIISTPAFMVSYFISPYYDDNETKYYWLNENINSNDILCSTQPRTTSYFTNHHYTVKLDSQHNETTIDSLIDEYNITYLIFNGYNRDTYRSNDFLNDFYEKEFGEEVFSSQKEFVLVHLVQGEKYNLYIYKVNER